MAPRAHAVAGALLAAMALPAGARAQPAIEPLRPCYVTAGTAKNPQGEQVEIQAAGFTPNSRVDMRLDGELITGERGVQVGPEPEGLLTPDPFRAPFVRSGSRDFTVTLVEQGNAANTVSATAKATALGVRLRPRSARPSQRISFKGRGFTAEKPVFAHYTRRGRQVERVRMARRTGECGSWSVRKPQFPMESPAQGDWIVQFDQSKKYVNPAKAPLSSVYVRITITVSLDPA
jgi:hypothetical protein